jgi:hypothetical protein
MTLIYAGVVPSKPGTSPQADLKRRATILLEKFEDSTIVLATISVAELLVPVPVHQKGPLTLKLNAHFHVYPFDLKAATIASDLWAAYKTQSNGNKVKYADRNVLKADMMIVASAKAAGATDFYSHDKECRKLAGLIMDSHDLPKQSEKLFSEEHLPKKKKKPD